MIKMLTALVIGGFLMRAAILALIDPTAPRSEEAIYAQRAIAWDRGQQGPYDLERAPGTTWLFRLIVLGFGDDLTTLRWGNVFLGTLLIALVYLWGSQIVNRNIALAAAALTAFHLDLIFSSASLYSEPLYVLLVYAAFFIFWATPGPFRVPRAILLGILVGFATLTRDVGLFLVPLLLFEILRRSRFIPASSLSAAGAFVIAFSLTLLPWTLHMSKRAGHFVLQSGMNERRLLNGTMKPHEGDKTERFLFTRQADGFNLYREFSNDPNERRVLARKMAMESIRQRLPWWPLEKVRTEVPIYFEPVTFPARRLLAPPEDANTKGIWAYEFSAPTLDRAKTGQFFAAGIAATNILTSLLGVAGIALIPTRRVMWPILIFAAAQAMPTLATTAEDRYRLPVTPILLLGTSIAMFEGRQLWERARRIQRCLTAAAVILMGIVLAA